MMVPRKGPRIAAVLVGGMGMCLTTAVPPFPCRRRTDGPTLRSGGRSVLAQPKLYT